MIQIDRARTTSGREVVIVQSDNGTDVLFLDADGFIPEDAELIKCLNIHGSDICEWIANEETEIMIDNITYEPNELIF